MNHLSDSVSIVDVEHARRGARRAHAARRRRAARHRLRRARAATAPSSPPRTAARTRRCTRPSRPSSRTAGHRPRRRLGLRRHQPRRHARRHAADHRHAVRRHAARARGHARTAARSTRRSSTPATRPRRSTRALCAERRRRGASGGAARRLPTANHFQGIPGPEVGLIVKFDGTNWRDELGRNWNSAVRFSLPDHDVFAIDANANPPIQVAGPTGVFAGVGTILFNMVVNPVSGKVYVSQHRGAERGALRGPGHVRRGFKPLGEPATVRGHLAESRITVLDGAIGAAAPPEQAHRLRHLLRGHPQHRERRQPRRSRSGMAVSSDGATLYVAAFGSSEIGVFDTAQLETDTFTPERGESDHGDAAAGRPALVLDEARSRLYVLTRFDNAISVIDTGDRHRDRRTSRSTTPSRPASWTAGRSSTTPASPRATARRRAPAATSSATSTAWPGTSAIPTTTCSTTPARSPSARSSIPDFHPMKGPMTTQSLRGMANHGPMHWRGDRTGGNDAAERSAEQRRVRRGRGLQEVQSAPSRACSAASAQLTAADMQAFTDFILQVTYPPNPIRTLDNSLTADQQAGRNFFFGARSPTRFQNCNGCHTLESHRQPVGVARPASSAPTALELRGRDAASSRSRTCATCTRRSACSACRRSPFINPGDNGFHGRSGPRLRLPARRQRRHALPLPQRRPSSTRAAATPAASRPVPPATRCAARWRPSCWPSTATCRRSSDSRSPARARAAATSIRASTCSSARPTPASAT